MSVLRLAISQPLRAISASRTSSHVCTRHTRQFSFTHQRRQGGVNPEELLKNLKHTKLFQEFQDNKELKDAIMEAAKVLQEEGFDISKPSMTMLLTNSKVRETVKKVTTALQAAGVDASNLQEAAQLIKANTGSK